MTRMQSTRSRPRQRRTLGTLIGAGLTVWLAAPASAQWFGGFEDDAPIPPPGIVRMLTGRGFSEITRPRFDGEVYRVEGTDRFGQRVRLTIDAYDGDIVERARIAYAGPPSEERLIPPRNVGRRQTETGETLPPPPIRGEPPRTAGLGEPAGPAQSASEPPVRKPAAMRPPSSEAKPAQPRVAPPAPAPTVTTAKPQTPDRGKPTATAAAPPAGPVRVIGGVTPLNPDQAGVAKEAPSEQTASTPETPPL